MSYKIVIDSCGELPEELKKDSRFEIVPLRLEVGNYQIEDDENYDHHYDKAESARCASSGCALRICCSCK